MEDPFGIIGFLGKNTKALNSLDGTKLIYIARVSVLFLFLLLSQTNAIFVDCCYYQLSPVKANFVNTIAPKMIAQV